MKRHPSLVPLSREHHQMLLLARVMRDDAPPYKGMPTSPSDKLDFARKSFTELISIHFEIEERLFNSLKPEISDDLRGLIDELINDHVVLRNSFRSLKEDKLDSVGRALEDHIRKEERVFFESLQKELGDRISELVQLK